MLFAERFWPGLADGSITLAFRRWTRPRARVGSRHTTPAGVLEIEAVEVGYRLSPRGISLLEATRVGRERPTP